MIVVNEKSIFVKYLNRPVKELIKNLAYPFFERWLQDSPSYMNWKNARIFKSYRLRNFLPYLLSILNLKPIYCRTKPDLAKAPELLVSIKLAIVVHVFYLDVFKEIMKSLRAYDANLFKLYITTTSVNKPFIINQLSNYHGNVHIHECINKGRDVLPFLQILDQVMKDGYNVVLKLHTKGSNHLNRRNFWKDDLFDKLIRNNQLLINTDRFAKYPRLGMLAPEGHVLPMSHYYGSNASRVIELLRLTQVSYKSKFPIDFIAGSMFFARIDVLKPILTMNIDSDDFEEEIGQLDGTLAHAIERIFTVHVPLLGFYLGDTNTSSYPDIRYKVTFNHRFTV